MSIFEEVGENIKKQMEVAIKKASEVGGYAKVQTAIKAEELKIQEQYYKLGKKYYALFQDAPDLELVDYVDTIDSLNRKIDLLKEEAVKMKEEARL